jgi:hypothetical protein
VFASENSTFLLGSLATAQQSAVMPESSISAVAAIVISVAGVPRFVLLVGVPYALKAADADTLGAKPDIKTAIQERCFDSLKKAIPFHLRLLLVLTRSKTSRANRRA